MKLSSSLAFLSTALLVPFSEAMSQLQQNWNIGNVVATNVKNDFTFQYPDTTPAFLGSDLSDKVRATIYGSGCKESDDSAWYATAGYAPEDFTAVTLQDGSDAAFISPGLEWSTTTTTYTNTTGDNSISIIGFSTAASNQLGHFADPLITGDIGENTELVQFTFTTVPSVMAQLADITSVGGNENESSMDFCVRVGLYAVAEDGSSNEINFQETLVTLTVTMDGNFDITSFGVAPKDKTSDSAQQTYTVKAELCTENQAEMDSNSRFNQGAAILVCISPDTQALIDGVIMTSIDSFNWERNYDDDVAAIAANSGTVPAPTTQAAITAANTVSDDGLTLIDTSNTKSFIVTSVLFAAFYATNGEVAADGSATMAFPSAAGRRLRNTDGNRYLQDADTSTVAPFEMVAELNRADDGPVAYVQTAAATGTGTSITVIATIVGLVSAILLA